MGGLMDFITFLAVGIFGSAFLTIFGFLLGVFLLPLAALILLALLLACWEGVGVLAVDNPAWLAYFGCFAFYFIALFLFSRTKIYKRMNEWLKARLF